MAELDVSELMTDPDFVDVLVVYRRLARTNIHGRIDKEEIKIVPNPIGSIQPGANPDMIRGTDVSMADDLITIFTNFRLQGITTRTIPDIVVYNGARYVVKLVNDWSAWGAGWVMAIASSEDSTEPVDDE